MITVLLVNLVLAGLAVIVLDGVNELATQLRRDDGPGDDEGGGGWRWRHRPRDPRDGSHGIRGGGRTSVRRGPAPRPRVRR